MCIHYSTGYLCQKCGHCVDMEWRDEICIAYKSPKSKACVRTTVHSTKRVDQSKCEKCNPPKMKFMV
ncbi:uncharacterized protein FTOL_08925 [Fusarium torulosum]|uniref:Uncharacterized protein n=1 Tax=Fusarium torulosum TaxID=33205 RepID=A0AAE8MEN2_9HYPO|nr:uncharacterized protein FTOL_08925 [Fusarium torulosum]